MAKYFWGNQKINETFFMRNIVCQDWRKCQEDTDGKRADAGEAG